MGNGTGVSRGGVGRRAYLVRSKQGEPLSGDDRCGMNEKETVK